jgi:predicted nucleotidyltransferase component of viral defense system
MLHLNTIDNATFNLLKDLMQKDYLQHFSLVGGTCLSLRYGHRKSIDIDLFSTNSFNVTEVDALLKNDYETYNYRSNNKYMLFCDINSIKTDLIYHSFKLLKPLDIIDGIRMFSIEDIIAMKLFAICRRGTQKDFFDIFQLLNNYSSKSMIEFFIEKYGYDQLIFLHKSILYFEEAEASETPQILTKNLNWQKVKTTIAKAFKDIKL